ncbi:hypothetical protein BD324DRAFT_683437 [Kockovaella imperatae]|uniref:CCD97-like C-terminal domain-containing protein n=1 Tax=Kockovaella imperatae TaxID=4999 RepID=A0A1Y1U8W8_9TREE|nr:hypothetical protein BD324DRAFT_683437 [Kockovaella imperatae]ORX34491.1 hypothetical protein BD324DRAFT_683437 [Kockovaella imperatae]
MDSDLEGQLSQEDVTRILTYLDLPQSAGLPLAPLNFLRAHLAQLPYELALPFAKITTPRQRSSIKSIKSRRLIYASSEPKPLELTAERGRLRWPLLWERMGGSSLPPPSVNVDEEESWVEQNFLPGRENAQHVKKLGGFLRSLEEEREMMEVVAARRVERRLDDVGEEFDEESDEEEGTTNAPGISSVPGPNANTMVPPGIVVQINQQEQEDVRRAFEKHLTELFVDGLDTVDYTRIDFAEPPGGDVTAERDQEDAYFAEQEPSDAVDRTEPARSVSMPNQNGQGEYDY